MKKEEEMRGGSFFGKTIRKVLFSRTTTKTLFLMNTSGAPCLPWNGGCNAARGHAVREKEREVVERARPAIKIQGRPFSTRDRARTPDSYFT